MTIITKGMGSILKGIFKPKKTSPTISSIKPAKNLTKKRADTEQVQAARTGNKLTSDSSKKSVRDTILKMKKINDKYKQ